MLLAERWFGLASLVVVSAGLGSLGVAARAAAHHRRAAILARVDLAPTRCLGRATRETEAVAVVVANPGGPTVGFGDDVDPYARVFERADLAPCFGDDARVEMLVVIAADGHVTRVSHRPERPTEASRCIARAVRHLQFPPADSAVSIRYAFHR